MTTRKPLGVSWESWVERQIADARRRGEFDDLPNRGKPLPGLDEPYDENWWARSYLRREGLSFLPATLQLKLDVERAVAKLERAPTEEAVRAGVAELNARIRAANGRVSEGPSSCVSRLDPERVVCRWRARRVRRGSTEVGGAALRRRSPRLGAEARIAAVVLGGLVSFTGVMAWLTLAA